MSLITKRQAEEIMLKLLLFQGTSEVIQNIVEIWLNNPIKLSNKVEKYFANHIIPFCENHHSKLRLQITDETIQKRFDLFSIHVDYKKALTQLESEISKAKDKTNFINEYLILLEQFFLAKNSIDDSSITFILKLLGMFDESQKILITFINKILSTEKNSLFRKLLDEIPHFTNDKMTKVIELLLEENEANGIPGLQICKIPKQLILYYITIQMNDQFCHCTLYQNTTFYELLLIIMINFKINIDLYDIKYHHLESNEEKDLNCNNKMYYKSLSVLFETTDEKANKYIIMTLNPKKCLIQCKPKQEYFKGGYLKEIIKTQLEWLFSYIQDRDLHLNQLFSYLQYNILQVLCNVFTDINYISREQFIACLSNKSSNDCYLLLHLFIGFRNNDLDQPYLRNIFPDTLIRNQIVDQENVFPALLTLIDKYKDNSVCYYDILKNEYQKKICFIYKPKILPELPRNRINLDIQSYNSDNNLRYKLIYKYLPQKDNVYKEIKLNFKNNTYENKYYLKICLNILMNNNHPNVHEKCNYIINQCSQLKLITIIQWNLVPILLKIFYHLKTEENYCFMMFECFFKLINKNNITQFLNQDILAFFYTMSKEIETNYNKNFITNKRVDEKTFERICNLITNKAIQTSEIIVYANLMILGKLILDTNVSSTLINRLVKKLNFAFNGIQCDESKYWPINHILIQLFHFHKYFSNLHIKNVLIQQEISLDDVVYLVTQRLSLKNIYQYSDLILLNSKCNSYNFIGQVLTNIRNSKETSLFYHYYDSHSSIESIPPKSILITSLKYQISDQYKMTGCIIVNTNNEEDILSYCFDRNNTNIAVYSNKGSLKDTIIEKNQQNKIQENICANDSHKKLFCFYSKQENTN